uniref:Major facilitator superfamily domain-containing protein 1-like n=1 Tax=Fundulus heteroclitus TaxID=8078 RepID=A0A3Q2NQD5_FUNHE
MAQPAEKAYYRFMVLFFNCLLTFGSYFCFDIPSVLQDQFQGNLTCPNATVINGTVECVEGLGMSPQQYNLLYAIYAWTNAVVVILAGFLIDKLGNRCEFACILKKISGVSNSFWFRGPFPPVCVQRVQDVKLLSLRYWLLVLTIMFFYNGIFPFIADASKFIQDKYADYSQKEAAYVAGAVYDSSLVLSACVGILIDYVGLRGVFAVACAVCTLPVFGLLAFTFVPPLVSTIWLGVTYSFAAASMWPSIPLVVPQATLGTAMGLATSIQMVGIGVSNLIVIAARFVFDLTDFAASVLHCMLTFLQGGTLNKTTKRSEQAEGDSEREPLHREEKEEEEEEEEQNGHKSSDVPSQSINS